MIPETVLQQIQDRLDIVEIISASVPLKRSGRSFKAPCPFHMEKTPSFYVTPDKQIFHCFGCGVGGNIFRFLMMREKKDFLEVVKELAERVGVELPTDASPKDREREERLGVYAKANGLAMNFYHEFLLKSSEAQKARMYLRGRGLNEDTIEKLNIGFAPDRWDGLIQHVKGRIADKTLEKVGLLLERKEKNGYYDRFRNRVIFPILDMKGACVAFGGRVMDDSVPKYMNSPESEFYTKGQHLYGLYWARPVVREKDALIVVEGYMDFAMLFQAGVQNVVASLGTALTREQVRLIKRHTHNVFMLYDADKAGEAATLRGLELFLEEGLEVKIVRLPQGHDPDSFVLKEGAQRFHEELGRAKNLFDYKLALLRAESNAQTVEGRVKIANEMVALLAKVQNEILRAA
jgi:DNA primase